MNDVQTIRLHRTDAMVVSGASRASSIGDWYVPKKPFHSAIVLTTCLGSAH